MKPGNQAWQEFIFLPSHRAPTPEMASWAVSAFLYRLESEQFSPACTFKRLHLSQRTTSRKHISKCLDSKAQGQWAVCIRVSRMLVKTFTKYKLFAVQVGQVFWRKAKWGKKWWLCVKKTGSKERYITFKVFIVSYKTMLKAKLHRKSEINSRMKSTKIEMLVCFIIVLYETTTKNIILPNSNYARIKDVPVTMYTLQFYLRFAPIEDSGKDQYEASNIFQAILLISKHITGIITFRVRRKLTWDLSSERE